MSDQSSMPRAPAPVHTEQPKSQDAMAMNAQEPQASQDDRSADESELTLRGGEACPGRFCFIIPCPIPCNFCVFPCPC
ncbi:hypothetical protein VD0002_g4079 [Verticillium dahliae]|uniref:Uncharacterized protein n=2 Tax=Verticillium TaxID=1036719 RepID=A0A2J8CPP4_VERDA|nr:hypothetical protein VdG2_05284 [Verticillium dahliae VDG2]KAF3352624.1 Delta(24(24(1)))-sterol reductase [Verticillium dahliae VDG1]KAG7100597.1 hypothetical protein HYQ44_019949 [Verticillium longisporum]KAH6703859.1 hypothetical protein EV126DRAFT_508395 [Verticillium dahliae]KAG7144305.1 hypothetical protein HYQ46_006957 [Verticillium longisporum]